MARARSHYDQIENSVAKALVTILSRDHLSFARPCTSLTLPAQPHPGLIPAAFMIGSSRASSLARNAFISAGDIGIGVAPRSA